MGSKPTTKFQTYARGFLGTAEFRGECIFEVPTLWAEMRIKEHGYDSLKEFMDEYTFDDTEIWVEEAKEEGKLLSVEIIGGVNND